MEKETKKKVLSSKEKRKNVINCVIAVLVAVIFLFPIYWILAMSFKSDAESFGKIVTYYPHNFTIDPCIVNCICYQLIVYHPITNSSSPFVIIESIFRAY